MYFEISQFQLTLLQKHNTTSISTGIAGKYLGYCRRCPDFIIFNKQCNNNNNNNKATRNGKCDCVLVSVGVLRCAGDVGLDTLGCMESGQVKWPSHRYAAAAAAAAARLPAAAPSRQSAKTSSLRAAVKLKPYRLYALDQS